MKALLLFLLCAFCLTAADVTGTWTGTFTPDGAPKPEPALVILKQDGAKVTGTVGGGGDDRHEIASGKAENGVITIEVSLGEGKMIISLKQDGDAMSGDVTAERGDRKMTAKLALKREK